MLASYITDIIFMNDFYEISVINIDEGLIEDGTEDRSCRMFFL